MCLAIPGKVVDTYDQRGLLMAKVQFGGIVREACLEYVPETQVGAVAAFSADALRVLDIRINRFDLPLRSMSGGQRQAAHSGDRSV